VKFLNSINLAFKLGLSIKSKDPIEYCYSLTLLFNKLIDLRICFKRDRLTYTQTYRCAEIQTYRHTDTQTHIHSYTQTHRHIDTQTISHMML